MLRLIVMPQAMRAMGPLILNQIVIVFQDTSLVYVVSLHDFLTAASVIASRDGRATEMYSLVAVVYLVICLSITKAAEFYKEKASVMIVLDDVHKFYGSQQILRGCSATISLGEVVVVCEAVGLRQEHADQVHQRLGAVRARHDHGRRRLGLVAQDRPARCVHASAWFSRALSSTRI